MPPRTKIKSSLKLYWQLLSAHIKPQRGAFVFLLGLLLGSVGLRIFAPQIMRSFIDSALAGKPLSALLAAAGAFIGVALVQQGVAIATNYLGEKVAWRATNALRGELAAHALRLDMSFHNNTSPGQLIERIDGDVAELSNFFSFFALMLASNILLLLGILAALFAEDWRAGLGFAAFVMLSMYLLLKFKSIARPFVKARREGFTAMFGFIEEQLSGTEDLRSAGAVDYSIKHLIKHSTGIFSHTRKSTIRMFFLNLTIDVLLSGGLVLAMVLGFKLHSLGLISAGTVYLFVHYLGLLDEPMWAMTRQMESFQTISACVERLNEFQALRPKVGSGLDMSAAASPLVAPPLLSYAPPDEAGFHPVALRFEDVTFSYNEEDTVLHAVGFDLPPRRILGVLGRTGSGKSTLVRLVARLYDPQAGRILYDGRCVGQIDPGELRHRVAMVTQDVQLFRASIRDNLTFFDRSYRDEALLAAMEKLGLSGWLAKQARGLDTQLDSGGKSLSAGEAQLLAFTRVFLRDPGLVILDEASSRLDPATEQLLEQAIDRLLAGRSAIVIAHRLATVRRADDILILEKGRVVEYGPRAGLEQNPDSRFSQLLVAGLEEVLA